MEPLSSIWKTNMLRLKRKAGGEVNIAVEKIVSFIDAAEGGSEVLVEGGLTYSVNESPQSIRNALKKAGFEFN